MDVIGINIHVIMLQEVDICMCSSGVEPMDVIGINIHVNMLQEVDIWMCSSGVNGWSSLTCANAVVGGEICCTNLNKSTPWKAAPEIKWT
jgi:hypothetical protein